MHSALPDGFASTWGKAVGRALIYLLSNILFTDISKLMSVKDFAVRKPAVKALLWLYLYRLILADFNM